MIDDCAGTARTIFSPLIGIDPQENFPSKHIGAVRTIVELAARHPFKQRTN